MAENMLYIIRIIYIFSFDRNYHTFHSVNLQQRVFKNPNLASVALRGLQAAASQAAVRRGATAADDLQLFFGPVGSVQKLLNELLQAYLSVCFTGRRLLKELVNLGDLPVGTRGRGVNLSFLLEPRIHEIRYLEGCGEN